MTQTIRHSPSLGADSPDVWGSADFPGGSSAELWESIQAILALPDDTRPFVGHDYGRDERTEPAREARVAEHLERNIPVASGTSKKTSVTSRDERDATLPLPERMLAALQVNLRSGRLPAAEANGRHYPKIPVNRFPEGGEA